MAMASLSSGKLYIFFKQTLNKEQGIEWIKKERLASFLESECYLEYRLANLVSQAQPAGDPGERVSLRLDRTPRAPPVRKQKEEPPEEPDEDEVRVGVGGSI